MKNEMDFRLFLPSLKFGNSAHLAASSWIKSNSLVFKRVCNFNF